MTREERRERRERYKAKGKAENTLKAYATGWMRFGEWCEGERIERANATGDDVADYLCHMADEGQPNGKPYSRATIKLHRSGLNYHFREAGRNPNPAQDAEVLKVLEGIARETGETRGQPDGLRGTDVARIMRYRPAKVRGPNEARQIARGKLAIRLMYDAALRIGEAAALRWEDVMWPEPDADGEVYDDQPAKIIIRQSKTDQYGDEVVRSISADTRLDLMAWEGLPYLPPYTGEPSGPILGVKKHRVWADFRKLVDGAGIEGRMTPHSCRIGATIDAYVIHGMDVQTIKTLGRWESTAMVEYYLKPYLKTLDPMAETFTDDPLAATFASKP